jgi:hypothetical protein
VIRVWPELVVGNLRAWPARRCGSFPGRHDHCRDRNVAVTKGERGEALRHAVGQRGRQQRARDHHRYSARQPDLALNSNRRGTGLWASRRRWRSTCRAGSPRGGVNGRRFHALRDHCVVDGGALPGPGHNRDGNPTPNTASSKSSASGRRPRVFPAWTCPVWML